MLSNRSINKICAWLIAFQLCLTYSTRHQELGSKAIQIYPVMLCVSYNCQSFRDQLLCELKSLSYNLWRVHCNAAHMGMEQPVQSELRIISMSLLPEESLISPPPKLRMFQTRTAVLCNAYLEGLLQAMLSWGNQFREYLFSSRAASSWLLQW